jgi:hypothetical protein
MEKATCGLCGEPMPEGETVFKYHGYSGPCPKPPLPQPKTEAVIEYVHRTVDGEFWIDIKANGELWAQLGPYDTEGERRRIHDAEADTHSDKIPDEMFIWDYEGPEGGRNNIRVGDLRRARDVLSSLPHPPSGWRDKARALGDELEALGYQRLFNALAAAATPISINSTSISVAAFIAAIRALPTPPEAGDHSLTKVMPKP